MTEFSRLALAVDARGVATLTLNRPDKHNAIDAAMIRELRAAAAAIAADRTIRVLVITGAGKVFCAGADLNWMRDQMAKDRAGRIAEASEFATVLADFDGLGVPVIARVQGPAYGGGIGLISVCDTAVAADTATFVLSETRLGLIPATIGPYVVRRLGEGGARQVFFNSRPFDAARALQLGLISRAVPAGELDAAVAEDIAACLNCAPGAVAEAKALAKSLARNPGVDATAATVARLADRWESDEGKAGLEAFFARTAPPWAPK